MILIPVKNLAHAKQRLAPVLDQTARTALAQTMLEDVLKAVNLCRLRPEVSLVTDDPFATQLAHGYRCEIIPDVGSSETEAVEHATQICSDRGMSFTLVIPADIPLIKSSELETILGSAPPTGTVLVPSHDRRGTNAAFRRPSKLFPLRFGNDSYTPHLAAARATGKPCVELDLSGIALDIDTPSDLQLLASAPGETKSQALARKWSTDALTQAANDR